MRERVVMIDAGFEAVLGTVLILGVVFGDIDHRDFPNPASDIVIAALAFGLFALALVLATLVKNEAVTDGVLRLLATGNAAFAVLIAIWAAVADGFSPAGEAVVWVSAVLLLLLAANQALLIRPARR